MQDIINKSESELKSKKIYFESMSFRREANHPDKLKYEYIEADNFSFWIVEHDKHLFYSKNKIYKSFIEITCFN